MPNFFPLFLTCSVNDAQKSFGPNLDRLGPLLLLLLLACLHFAAFTISLHFLNKLCDDCATKRSEGNDEEEEEIGFHAFSHFLFLSCFHFVLLVLWPDFYYFSLPLSLSSRGACLTVSSTLFGFEYLFYWLRNLRVPVSVCIDVCVPLLVVSVEICSKFKMWNLSERKATLVAAGWNASLEQRHKVKSETFVVIVGERGVDGQCFQTISIRYTVNSFDNMLPDISGWQQCC